ncbi:MFS transporter [Bacillus sp. 165]|uniref:MFS transporter n=1 Tax=Bacillus sp. 165 TaxID=1529117 RepID=UPI001ADCDA75|nr:MFS transporter [Bacillus sp. 165]MBO9128523.1 MFS transporter [Bacillus sp. 165]
MTSSVWKNRNFMWLFTGRTISQLGTSITTFSIPWLLLELTNSAAQTGLAFAVGFIPYLLFSLPAGVWADQYNRKTLMIIADSCRMLLLLSIPLIHVFSGDIPILLLYFVQAGTSVFSAIFDASYGACLPNIINRAELQEGNSALQMGFSLSRIGGPIIAGLLISILGAANTISLDVISYVISILTIFFIRASFSASVNKNDESKNETKLHKKVREGLEYVWKIKLLRTLALFSMLVNLVGPGIDIALLFRIKNELHLASNWVGIIMAGLSCGMVVGAITIGRIKKRLSMGFLLAISTIGQVFPAFLLIVSKEPIVILFTQFIVGFLLIAWNIQTVALRQLIVPDHLLGRCTSLFRMIAWITIPLGTTIAGVLSEFFGASFYFLIAGCVLGVVCLIFISSKLYSLDEEDIDANTLRTASTNI